VESKWKNDYIITFPGLSLSKNRDKFEMPPPETKQSTGKLLHPSDLQKVGGGGVLTGNTTQNNLQIL
jgi:hypothetical protein